MGPTVAEMKESLDKLGVVYKATMRKGDLAALLEQHQAAEQPDHYSPPFTRHRKTMSAADIAVSQPLNPAGALLEKFDEEPESLEDEVDVKIFRESSPIKESVIEEQVTEIVKENGVDHSEENGVGESEVKESSITLTNDTESLTDDHVDDSTEDHADDSTEDHVDDSTEDHVDASTEEFVIIEKDEVDGEDITESEVTGSSEVPTEPLSTITSLMEPSPTLAPAVTAEEALVTESVITSVLENSPEGKIVTRSTTKRRSTRMSRHTACSAALFSDDETIPEPEMTVEPEELTVEDKEITPGGQSIRKILIISILLVILANLVAYLHINNPGLIAGYCNTVKSWFVEEPSAEGGQ